MVSSSALYSRESRVRVCAASLSSQTLEGGEDGCGPLGRPERPSGKSPAAARREAPAQLGLDQPEDEQRQADYADQRLDAIVVVEEDRPHSHRASELRQPGQRTGQPFA
jgi:hypothetical protein